MEVLYLLYVILATSFALKLYSRNMLRLFSLLCSSNYYSKSYRISLQSWVSKFQNFGQCQSAFTLGAMDGYE